MKLIILDFADCLNDLLIKPVCFILMRYRFIISGELVNFPCAVSRVQFPADDISTCELIELLHTFRA